MMRPDIQATSPEIDLPQLNKILRAMPGNMIERYMVDSKGQWSRWAVRFIDFYGRCSEQERVKVAEVFSAHFTKSASYLPPDLHMMEILWDFGEESSAFAELADLFHRLVARYRDGLEPKQFQSVVIHRLQEGGIIPRSEWGQYDSREQIPSPETKIRLEHAESDAARERRLLERHELPDDPDDMTHMLKKMKKGKMGLPHWPEFLAQVRAHFQASPDWPDIQREIEKIQAKFPQWAAIQVVPRVTDSPIR